MNKIKSKEILTNLKEVIQNPICELHFTNLYELLCAVSISAQTTDKRVNEVTPSLFSKYPTPFDLMNANYDDVFTIVRSLGLAQSKAKNLIAMAEILHEQFNDVVPNTFEDLQKLPGVGRKTASVILAVGFQIPAVPVDTHLHRMAIRLGFAQEPADVGICEQAYRKYIAKEDWIEAHHLLLLFGRYYCKAKNPLCLACKLKAYCQYAHKEK